MKKSDQDGCLIGHLCSEKIPCFFYRTVSTLPWITRKINKQFFSMEFTQARRGKCIYSLDNAPAKNRGST
uniref:Uncharacterized protein n=1 Tax=Populus trichocarpa x Populus deltoides TaxID=3695 RepID=A9PK46_9ROSI|nr:unknown [Populus trichocarpa x Populus deltoides]